MLIIPIAKIAKSTKESTKPLSKPKMIYNRYLLQLQKNIHWQKFILQATVWEEESRLSQQQNILMIIIWAKSTLMVNQELGTKNLLNGLIAIFKRFALYISTILFLDYLPEV